jgi:GTPase SAR1 family protein
LILAIAMVSPRLLIVILGLCIVLGLMIWLVGALQQLYWQIAYSANPLLANLLLLLLIVLAGVLIAALIYSVYLFQRPSQSKRLRSPRVSEVKSEAAQETLSAVRQQVNHIQDEVARQALLQRSREIEANLNRRELQVVVFGTGSAGKTSIVNVLMGQIVGMVGAPMGTTAVGETYCLRLQGIDRDVLITDTPGILEVGVAGTQREQLARQLATEADLLIFVVEGDLRQSEYSPLQALAVIGKRSILAFNKIDRYSEVDRETILARLRERVRGWIPASDVVAIAANPTAIALETGEVVQPDPEVLPLLRRMADILRSEGEDLVADNILLQSQRLGEEARRLIDAQRLQQAEKVVERFQWISAGVVAATPLPVIDLLGAAAVNAQMVVEIGKIYGCELNLERGRELAISLAKTLVSLGIVKGAMELLTLALEASVAGFLAGRVIQGVSAAYLTRIAGKSFIEYFRHDQDWGDGGITEVVQQQFQLNRRDEFMKAFVQEAIARVIKPLT